MSASVQTVSVDRQLVEEINQSTDFDPAELLELAERLSEQYGMSRSQAWRILEQAH